MVQYKTRHVYKYVLYYILIVEFLVKKYLRHTQTNNRKKHNNIKTGL